MIQLTPRQWQVLELIAEGMKNAEIASVLGTTEHVIKNYARPIYDATGMSNRTELALWYVHNEKEIKAIMNGIVEIPHINSDDGLDYTPGYPGWVSVRSSSGLKLKPVIRCNCGWYCGLGLHHVHADGIVTASFFHTPECDPGRGCGWHVFLKLKDYNEGDFPPVK